jgi:hypothetical protein
LGKRFLESSCDTIITDNDGNDILNLKGVLVPISYMSRYTIIISNHNYNWLDAWKNYADQTINQLKK